ncbi:MAG: DUF4923 family protein [Bacteroidales bacterium]|nr:DUF4923 family protein [Bacteroidales bacterium]
MKRILLVAAALLCMATATSAQNGLGGLLGKITGSDSSEKQSGSGSLISSITDLISGKSTLTAADLVGTWNYTGSAVSFKSEQNVLSNLASGVAESTITNKIDGYLSKVGISKGLFGYTFNEDGSMCIKYGSREFKGIWTFDEKTSTVKMKMASFVNSKGYVAVKNGKMELLFDVTTLMKIIKSVTSVYNNATLQSLNAVLNQYDQMYAGFKMTK